jgi:hypothetical protein
LAGGTDTIKPPEELPAKLPWDGLGATAGRVIGSVMVSWACSEQSLGTWAHLPDERDLVSATINSRTKSAYAGMPRAIPECSFHPFFPESL